MPSLFCFRYINLIHSPILWDRNHYLYTQDLALHYFILWLYKIRKRWRWEEDLPETHKMKGKIFTKICDDWSKAKPGVVLATLKAMQEGQLSLRNFGLGIIARPHLSKQNRKLMVEIWKYKIIGYTYQLWLDNVQSVLVIDRYWLSSFHTCYFTSYIGFLNPVTFSFNVFLSKWRNRADTHVTADMIWPLLQGKNNPTCPAKHILEFWYPTQIIYWDTIQ